MVFQLSTACGSHVGKARQNHEDNFCFNGATLPMVNDGLAEIVSADFVLTQPCCFGVFDGMGGVEFGEVAAFLAADTLKQKLPELGRSTDPRLFLEETCDAMNRVICRESERSPGGRMGTTAAMALCTQGMLYACNLGDSRIYRLRGQEFLQLSRDHVETFPPGMNARRKPRLTQHLGIHPEDLELVPHIFTCDLQKDDMYLLCSDGLWDMLSQEEIRQALYSRSSVRETVSRLLDTALQNGGRDNVTVIAIRVQ